MILAGCIIFGVLASLIVGLISMVLGDVINSDSVTNIGLVLTMIGIVGLALMIIASFIWKFIQIANGV